jgi:hypothetical protein
MNKISTTIRKTAGICLILSALVIAVSLPADLKAERLSLSGLKGEIDALDARLSDCEQGINATCPGSPGPQGDPGTDGVQVPAGLSCWDLNGNGEQDPLEDTNGDGVYNALDCAGSVDLGAILSRLADLEARLRNSDFDSDGFTPSTGDCNDANFDINPAAAEGIIADGLDNNCDGVIDNSVSPPVLESPFPVPSAGEVFVTEYMAHPAGLIEWIELFNGSTETLALEGCIVTDLLSGRGFTITGLAQGTPAEISPSSFAVLASSDFEAVDPSVPVFEWGRGNFSLNNFSGAITLRCDAEIVDDFSYQPGEVSATDSRSLNENFFSAAGNDDPASWCNDAENFYGFLDNSGTPGVRNVICP